MLLLTLPTIIGAGTISVDLSSQKVARTQLQAVSDIAAMAGTNLLDGTAAGLVAAQDTAARAAARNSVGGVPVVIPDAQMLLGAWDSTSQTLSTTAATADINSIQVEASRDNLETSFAKVLLNQRTMGASGRSTGFNPPDDAASSVSCYLPIAIPACLFDRYTTEELSDITLVLNPAGIDNAGWARVGGRPNASWIRDQLEDCEQDGIATVGDEVGLQNGAVSDALDEIHDQLVDSETEWDDEEWGEEPDPMCHSALVEDDDDDEGEDCDEEDDSDHEHEDDDEADDDSSDASGHSDDDHGHSAHRSSEDDDESSSEDDDESSSEDEEGYGKTLEGPIIVFDGGADYCEGSGGQYNGYEPVIGFAWGVIYDVRTQGSASEKNMRVKIDTEAEEAFGLVGGGTLYAGVTHATPGVIVR